MINKAIQKIYDAEAQTYDARYLDPMHLVEDKIVGDLIKSALWVSNGGKQQRVLDVGCGTGHVIDITGVSSKAYQGIDISSVSVDIAKDKFPDYNFLTGDITEHTHNNRSDLMLFIYGQVNYIGLEGAAKALKDHLRQARSSKYMAIMYSGRGHLDYEYTSPHQMLFKPSEIRQAFSSDYWDAPSVNGFSFYDCPKDYDSQLSKTLINQMADGEESQCKYLIASNLDVFKNEHN